MKHKFLFATFLLFACALAMTASAAANLDTVKVDGIWYILNKTDLTATVTYGPATGQAGMWGGIGSNTYSGHLNIPETVGYSDGKSYNTYAVTAVGNSAFAWNSGLTQITIPASVKTLGVLLFQRTSGSIYLHIADSREPLLLNTEEMETGIYTALEDGAQIVTTLYMGRNLETDMAFHTWNALERVVFGRFVTNIPVPFCPWCRNIKSIQVNTPAALQAGIRMFAFLNEDNPKPDAKTVTLYVPAGLAETYANMDFWKDLNIQEMDMEQLNLVKFADGYWDLCDNGIFFKRIDPDDASKGMRVVRAQVWYLNPDGSKIDPSHTSQWPYQQSVIDIPAEVTFEDVRYAVTAISDYCFRDAKNLEQLTIPNSVTEVGASIMDGTPRLKKVVIPESVTKIGWLAFCRSGIEEVWIPASSNNWNESGAFQESRNLRTIHFADGITKIGDSMFRGCDALQTITIPDGVSDIGNGAFAECSGLSEIHLPTALEFIGPRMFAGCPLRKLQIPAGVENIAPQAFYKTALVQLTVDAANRTYEALGNAVVTRKDHILVAACNGTTIHESVKGIAGFAFSDLNGIRSLTLPENLKQIDERAFYNLPNLTLITSYIKNPAGVLSVGAFMNDDFEGIKPTALETATLYIPEGTMDAYLADAEWTKFGDRIVEMTAANKPAGVEDLAPVTEDGAADFGKLDGKNLGNAVVDNMYFTCDPANGDRYDNAEQALILNTVVDELMLQNILGEEGNMDILRNNFSGIVLEIPAGKGSVKIEAKVTGDRKVAVLISGMGSAMTFDPAAKTELTIPYEVLKKAFVYIYGIYAPASASAPYRAPSKVLRAPQAAEDANLMNNISIYGAKWIIDEVTTGVEEIENHDVARPNAAASRTQKLLRNGEVLILRDGKLYNLFGTQVQ